MTLPRFLGIGAMKAGTSTLHDLLATHPDVALPASRKEVMYFDRYADRGLDWYASHWPDDVGHRVPGEITPGYLFDPQAPARVAAALPGVRLVVLLRDPVERALSQWRFFVKEHAYTGDADAFLAEHPNAVDRGHYAAQLDRWLDHVDRDQLGVWLFEDLVADPGRVFAEVCAHIGVDPTFVPPGLGRRSNASTVPRFHRAYAVGRRVIGWMYAHDLGGAVQLAKRIGLRRVFLRPDAPRDAFAPVSEATRARLRATYRDDAARLPALVGCSPGARWSTGR